MNYKLLASLILFALNVYSQTEVTNDTIVVDNNKILRNYFTVGIGATNNYINFGVGWFSPVGENILIGPRVNAHIELELIKRPEEMFWDVELVVRYVPFISERILFSIGAGAGYSKATVRGEFLRDISPLVKEYVEETTSSLSLLGEIDIGLLITNNLGISLSGYILYANNRTLTRFQIGLFLCKIITLE